jgi:hypothetical protein
MFGVIASSQFNPRTVTNIKNWYDASDINGNLTRKEQSTVISAWADKSGNNYTATGSVDGPVMVYSAFYGTPIPVPVADFASLDLAKVVAPTFIEGNGTIVTVFAVNAFSTCAGLLSATRLDPVQNDYGTAGISTFLAYCNDLVMDATCYPLVNMYSVSLATGPTYPGNLCCLISTFDFDNGYNTWSIDNSGALVTGTKAPIVGVVPFSFSHFTLGCRWEGAPTATYTAYSDCDIAEMFAYNRALNSQEINSIRSYLRTKYSFSNLGVFH